MKKISLYLLALTTLASACQDCSLKDVSSDTTGHTFLTLRRPFIAALPEVVSGPWRGAAFKRECPIYGALQVVPLGGQSTNAKNLAQYFTFCNKDTLSVGSSQQGSELPDINPTHFNVEYTQGYSSTISFRPQHSFAGFGLEWRQFLGNNSCRRPRWFIDVNMAVFHVKNDLNLKEENIAKQGTLLSGSAPTLTDAFTGGFGYRRSQNGNVKMCYGRINGAQSTTRVQDIEFKLGYQIICDDTCHAAGYMGLDIPTGNKPRSCYLFEPIVGQNQQAGIMGGLELGMQIWKQCEHSAWWELNGNTRYLIRNPQRRLIPLKFRPWSQYMLTYANADDRANGIITPGPNIFNRLVRVEPHFLVDINNALVYNHCGFQLEIGYNFWSRSRETVKLDRPWELGPVLAALDSNNALVDGTNRLSNIGDNNQGANIPVAYINLIRESDLDLNAAATPCSTSHIVYGTFGYCLNKDRPIFFAAGGSYELSWVANSLKLWTVWAKIGMSL